MKKFILTLLPLILLSACNSSTSEEKPIVFDGKVSLNGFNSINEMYKAQQMVDYRNYDFNATLDIVNDKNFVKEGEGCLSVDYRDFYGSYAPGSIIQRIDISPISTCDVFDINKTSCWIYNDNEVETNASLVIFIKGEKTIYEEEFKLAPKQYTYCESNLSKLLLENSYENILGFGINLSSLVPAHYYIDDWCVEFDAEYNDDDIRYLSFVSDMMDEIDLLPSINLADYSDETFINHIEEIGTNFYQMPVVYQNSVANRQHLFELMDGYQEYYRNTHYGQATYYGFMFDKSFGLRQVELLNSMQGMSASYDTEYHIEGEVGSLKITSNGANSWNYVNFNAYVDLSNYKTMQFYVYNDTQLRAAICMNWSEEAIILPAQAWTKISIAVAKTANIIECETTALDERGVSGIGIDGNLYFSSIVFKK